MGTVEMSLQELQALLATTATITKDNAVAAAHNSKQIDALVGKVDEVLQSQFSLLTEHRQNTSTVTRLLSATNGISDQVDRLVRRVVALETGCPRGSEPGADNPDVPEQSESAAHRGGATRTVHVQELRQNQGERRQPRFPVAFDLAGGNIADEESGRPPPPRFGHAKMPRTDFPRFDGEDPKWWKDCCEKYFHMFAVPSENWAAFATLHFQGIAKSWLQSYESLHRIATWSDLVIAVFAKFEVNKYEQQLEQLFKLKQTGTVTEYHVRFQELMHRVLTHNQGYDETFLVNRFVNGLKSNIRIAIRLHTPKTIDTALGLALVQEEELELQQKKPYFKADFSRTSGKIAPPVTGILGTIPEGDKKQSKVEEKYDSLRAMRRAKGLCFKCGDKYAPGHKCAAQVSLHVLEELLEALQLETKQDSASEQGSITY